MHCFFNILLGQVEQPADNLHILASSQMPIVGRGLNQRANGRENITAGLFVERFSHNLNGSAGGLDKTEQHFHGGGLARPVRAEETVNIAFFDPNIQFLNTVNTVIFFRQIICCYNHFFLLLS